MQVITQGLLSPTHHGFPDSENGHTPLEQPPLHPVICLLPTLLGRSSCGSEKFQATQLSRVLSSNVAQLSQVINQPAKAEACIISEKPSRIWGVCCQFKHSSSLLSFPYFLSVSVNHKAPFSMTVSVSLSVFLSISLCLWFKIMPLPSFLQPRHLPSHPTPSPPRSLAAAIDSGSQLGHRSLHYCCSRPLTFKNAIYGGF